MGSRGAVRGSVVMMPDRDGDAHGPRNVLGGRAQALLEPLGDQPTQGCVNPLPTPWGGGRGVPVDPKMEVEKNGAEGKPKGIILFSGRKGSNELCFYSIST